MEENSQYYEINDIIIGIVALCNLWIFLIIKANQSKKKIQKILEERGLWLAKKLNLCYSKSQYFNHLVAVDYKIPQD